MEAVPEPIYEVTEADFEERVIRASSQRPVAVDFWAPWCAPCRMLGPALERVVRSFGGRMALAKLNVDGAPGLASRYGVQGIPAVKVFQDGRVAAEFVGARGEREVKEILSRIVSSEADELTARAAELLRSGRTGEAEEAYNRVLEDSPGHPGALLGLARIALEREDFGAARESASRIDPGAEERGDAEGILARLDILEECARLGGREAAGSSDEMDAAYARGVCLAAEGGYEEALRQLLALLERDKRYRGGAAKDAMVRIFSIVGKRSRLADEYRSRLAGVLY